MKRQAYVFTFLIGGLATVAPLPSHGQAPLAHAPDEPSEALELIKEEESVSIAARHEQPISQAPQNVYVITEEEIRHSGNVDLPTILRRIPGMEVMQTTGADFNVSVRGDNQNVANKLLVLVDGRSIYEDINGQVWWKAIPVTLPEIKRIEVLKGPASALYGFNAFDGVINIITKSAEEMKGATVQFGGGAFGTISSAAIYANTHGKLGYRLSYGHDQNQQWRNGDALAFRDNKFNGQLEYALPDESKLTLSGGYVDTNAFDAVLTGNFLRSPESFTNGHATALYEKGNFFVRLWWQNWNNVSPNIVDPSIARFISITDRFRNPTALFRQDSYNAEAQHAVQLGATNRLTYGFNLRHNTGSSNVFTGQTIEDRLGLYIQDEWHVTNTLTAVAGLRYDLDSFINPTYSPRGALIYQPAENHTFRLSTSVAYRPPTMFQFNSNSSSTVTIPRPPPLSPITSPGVQLGSDSLNPEKIVSVDLGYQGWFFKHRLRLRGDVFFNHITDLIGSTRISTTPSVLGFSNNGVADIHGFEAGIEYLATSWLSGFVNYSYEKIGQHFDNPDLLRGAPRDKVNAGLRADWANGLRGEVSFNYVSSAAYPVSNVFAQFSRPPFNGPLPPSSNVGSYTLLNLYLAYAFWKDRAEVAFSVFNALNDVHKEFPLGDEIGSRAMGWLTIKL